MERQRRAEAVAVAHGSPAGGLSGARADRMEPQARPTFAVADLGGSPDQQAQLSGALRRCCAALSGPVFRSGGGTPAPGDVGARFERATAGPGAPVPYQARMEAAFGSDFSTVRAYHGQDRELAGMGARAAASGEKVVFGAGTPSPELVAHELAHVVQQRRAGGGRVQPKPRVSQPGDAAEREADRVGAAVAAGGTAHVREAATGIHGGWLDAVGDALDARTDEARLDAEEELEEFRARSFPPLADFQPSSDRGLFDARFDPRSGAYRITIKVSFDFVDGDAASVAPGYRAAEFQWTPDEQRDWKARYLADMSAAWSRQFTIRCTRAHWAALVATTTVDVREDAADPHFVCTVAKYPPDAAMTGSSVCPSGTHHNAAGNLCDANAPDASGAVPEEGSARLDSNDLRAEQKLDWSNPVVAIPFRRGSAALDAAGRTALTPVVTQLTAAAGSRVELTGRSSADRRRGVDEATGAVENMDLARARSSAVATEIVAGGVARERIQLRNEGQQGADATDASCRVDAQVGTQPTQSPGVHETGHMAGSGDHYGTAGDPLDASYDAMIQANEGSVLVRANDADVMSLGAQVRPWNYASFVEALKRITGMAEWDV